MAYAPVPSLLRRPPPCSPAPSPCACSNIPGVLAGIWAMFLGGLCLLLNVACQFSHTKRERELLSRIQAKHLVANP